MSLYLALLTDDRAVLQNTLAHTTQSGTQDFAVGLIGEALAAIARNRLSAVNSDRQRANGSERRRHRAAPTALHHLVAAERARAKGQLAKAAHAYTAAIDAGLPAALDALAHDGMVLLPGAQRGTRIEAALHAWRTWGAAQRTATLAGIRKLRPSKTVGAVATTPAPDAALNEVLMALHGLAGAFDLDALAARACREALRLCAARQVWLGVLDQEELRILGSATMSDVAPLPPPWELLRFTLRTGAVLRPGTQPELGPAAEHTLALPLRSTERCIGVLLLSLPETHLASARDAEPALQLFATHLEIALRNARLYGNLAAARDEFRTLFESSDEGLLQVGPDRSVIRVNAALARLLGHDSPEQLLAERQRFEHLFTAPDIATQLRDSSHLQTTALRRDGSSVWVALRVRTTQRSKQDGVQNSAIRYECSLSDITERKQREQAERERERAEATTQARSEFLAHMSHEIRTPLNAIVSAGTLALATEDVDRVRKNLHLMQQAATQLQALVNDVLDFARIDAGVITLDDAPFAIDALIQECRELFAPLADERGVALLVEAPAFAGLVLRGDATRLRQIVHNLLSNAVKFTHAGAITLSGRVLGEDAMSGVHIELRVRDSGIGIAPDVLSRLFEPFAQAHAGIARRYGGTGLGLTIVQRLVNSMHGRIDVHSVPGAGSEFVCEVTLTRAPCDALLTHSADDAPPPDIAGMRVLLVDDNAINRELGAQLLAACSVTALVAASAEAAVQIACEERCDAVLMDIHMPGTDGFAAARLLQRLPNWRGTPIIALSADASERARLQAEAAGFAGYLIKPIAPSELQRTLHALTSGSSTTIVPSTPRVVTTAPSTQDNGSPFNVASALAHHGGNTRLLTRLLKEFLSYYADAPADLAQLPAQGDDAERLMHNLKSLATGFGGAPFARASAALESALVAKRESAAASADDPSTTQDWVKLYEDFTTAHQHFVTALRGYLTPGESTASSSPLVRRKRPRNPDASLTQR